MSNTNNIAPQLNQNNEEFYNHISHYKNIFFNVNPQPACIAGYDGYFKLVNKSFQKLLGFSEEELFSKPYATLIHPSDLEASMAEANRLIDLSVKTIGFVNRFQKKDGNYLYLNWNVVPDRENELLHCSVIDMTKAYQQKKQNARQLEDYKLIISGINAGIWLWDIKEGNSWWSDELYTFLELDKEEVAASYSTFLNLIHPEDKASFVQQIENHFQYRKAYKIEVRIKTNASKYKWVECSGMSIWDEDDKPIRMTGTVIDINQRKSLRVEVDQQQFLLSEAGKMAKIGGWEVDLVRNKVHWSKEVYTIHEVDPSFQPDLESAIDFYAPESVEIISQAVKDLIEIKKEFDLECKFITGKGRKIWVRAIGTPIISDQGVVTGLRGVFQDIDKQKIKELELSQSVDIIQHQNQRLLNFAHIVSHNLRSHTSNFGNLIHLYNTVGNQEMQHQAFEQIEINFKRLEETINYLIDIVHIQTDINKQKQTFYFETEVQKVLDVLQLKAKEFDVSFETDFSECPSISYVGAYLQSILLNLISNTIKYHHPDRKPQVHIRTFLEDGHPVLTVRDNGLGIDMELNKEKIFGMYKTFHGNEDAKGIGLFLIRNQIEAIGGTISVKSQVNVGTTFKVKFS